MDDVTWSPSLVLADYSWSHDVNEAYLNLWVNGSRLKRIPLYLGLWSVIILPCWHNTVLYIQVGAHVCDVGSGGGGLRLPAGPGRRDGAHSAGRHPPREAHSGGVRSLPHASHSVLQQDQGSVTSPCAQPRLAYAFLAVWLITFSLELAQHSNTYSYIDIVSVYITSLIQCVVPPLAFCSISSCHDLCLFCSYFASSSESCVAAKDAGKIVLGISSSYNLHFYHSSLLSIITCICHNWLFSQAWKIHPRCFLPWNSTVICMYRDKP